MSATRSTGRYTSASPPHEVAMPLHHPDARAVVVAALLLATASCSGPRLREAEQTALRLEGARHEAQRSADAAKLDSILADDFVEIGAGGADRSKPQNVDEV